MGPRKGDLPSYLSKLISGRPQRFHLVANEAASNLAVFSGVFETSFY